MSDSTTPTKTAPTLRIQSILYGNAPHHVELALENLQRAIQLAVTDGAIAHATIALGDCSPERVFSDARIAELTASSLEFGIDAIDYRFFGENKGSAAGHNALLADFDSDLVLILNPDTIVAPNLFIELVRPLSRADVGMVEARQLPIEHPKDYDRQTGETGWATTACALVPKAVIKAVGGFDAETFFLYCDDVDFSWRVRLAGYKVIFHPPAVIFHDKRLSNEGHWMVGNAEEYYSAEAALMLAHKYGRPDLVAQFKAGLYAQGSELQKKAAATYDQRAAENRLPAVIENAAEVAEFIDGFYAKHRY
ncbi:glycosyltransferase family protein [Chitinimonas naiadis]